MKHPDQLAHSLRTRHITMIALGGIVGAGFFIGAASAVLQTGPVVFISYMLVGLLVFLINLSIRDLALKGPGGGSFMMQIRHVLGPRYGFMVGWGYWLSGIIVLGAEVVAGANMLRPYIHLPDIVIEVFLLLCMTGVNLLSVRGYGEFEYWFSIIKIVAIVLFIAVAGWGLLRAFLGWAPPVPVWKNIDGHGGLFPKGWVAVFAIIPTIFFSMTGSEIATVAALESDDPDRNIVRVTRTLAIRIVGFFLVSIALLLCFMPWNSMVPNRSPFLTVMQQIGVPFADIFVWIVIFTAVLSSLNSFFYVSSRILYEMAENEDAPLLFLKVDEKRKLPQRAIWACFIGAVITVLPTVVANAWMFAILLSLTGTIMLFNNLLIILARMRVDPTRHWQPWLACLLLACTFGAMLFVPATRSQVVTGTVAIIIIALGALWRYRAAESR